jgi:hypothetical protein
MLTADARWAVRLPAHAMPQAARLRLVAGVQFCIAEDALWLQGVGADALLWHALATLPGGQRYLADAAGACREPGRLLPTARLPEGPWQSLAASIEPVLPPPALPARIGDRVSLRVVRGAEPMAANVLYTALAPLAAWVGRTPVVWLHSLRFAVAAAKQVLVHGAVLPPLPGRVAVEQHGVALPAGCRFEPDCPRSLVAEVLGLQAMDLACFDAEGVCTLVRAGDFAMLTRSAVRQTLAVVGNG